jgi:LPXTG-motif cell wall-anchored protein
MTHRSVRLAGLVLLIAMGVGLLYRGDDGRAEAAEAPVGLGTADSFAVLAGTTVTNTGPSVITGDVGVSPGSAIVGFPPGIVVGGVFHAADAVALQAQNDTTTAYNDAAGRTMTAAAPADLAGQTLVGGVYTGPTLGLTGTVTLDAQGDPNTVWIFQSASTLITSSSSVVSLINGAQACNVYWQVGSSATLGTNSTFVGTILALTSITANTDATIQGRLLARNGAVTLDDNTIIRPNCAPPSTTTTSPTTIPGSTTSSSVPGSTTSSSVPGSTTSSSVPGSTTSSSVPGSTTTMAGGGGTTTTAPLGGPGGPGGRGSGGPFDTDRTSRNLPRTGNDLTPLAVAGLLAVTLGAGLVVMARRRNAGRSLS